MSVCSLDLVFTKHELLNDFLTGLFEKHTKPTKFKLMQRQASEFL